MKKLLIWIAGIIMIVVATDFLLGRLTSWYVNNYDLGGDYTSFHHLIKNFEEEGLVIGSSVALNSLDTRLLSDSLGKEYFNGASNGQTLPFILVALQGALDSPTPPKQVILGITPNELSTSGMGGRFNFLTPYYGLGYDYIDEGLEKMSAEAPLLLKSNLYRYNTIWFRILLYRFINPNEVGENGFIAKPIPGAFPTKKPLESNDVPTEERIAQFKKIIEMCRESDAELTVYFPPFFFDITAPTPTYLCVDSICRSEGITLYNDMNHPEFKNDSTLFYDNEHLNKDGAAKYTSLFHSRIKENRNR